jgi:hypothetical protein
MWSSAFKPGQLGAPGHDIYMLQPGDEGAPTGEASPTIVERRQLRDIMTKSWLVAKPVNRRLMMMVNRKTLGEIWLPTGRILTSRQRTQYEIVSEELTGHIGPYHFQYRVNVKPISRDEELDDVWRDLGADLYNDNLDCPAQWQQITALLGELQEKFLSTGVGVDTIDEKARKQQEDEQAEERREAERHAGITKPQEKVGGEQEAKPGKRSYVGGRGTKAGY